MAAKRNRLRPLPPRAYPERSSDLAKERQDLRGDWEGCCIRREKNARPFEKRAEPPEVDGDQPAPAPERGVQRVRSRAAVAEYFAIVKGEGKSRRVLSVAPQMYPAVERAYKNELANY